MAIEIEKKFLVINDDWRNQVCRSIPFHQGYLSDNEVCSVRVRMEGNRARLTIKSAGLDIQRAEYEYDIDPADALEMLENLCLKGQVTKIRHFVEVGRHTWEIDEFNGENHGLIVAEVELGSRDEEFVKPGWVGKEVSGDPRYMNNNLAKVPFKNW